MASKASQMHFALILVKGADDAWFGQRLPSRNPVHHTRSKMASSYTTTTSNNGRQPAMAEIARERTLPSISGQNKTRGNCDAEKSEKFNIICLKKSEKSEHFYVTHEHFLKKLALF